MFAIVVFPGSNCDHDCYHAVKHVIGRPARFLWHKETVIDKDIKCVVLPGGFSHGDYLRAGALARFSPIIKAVTDFAKDGGFVVGICNGFQILLESGLLPGAMLRNRALKFICKDVFVRAANVKKTPFTATYTEGRVIRLPIAHAEGNYYADAGTIDELKTHNQIIFNYCDKDGNISDEANPNGALLNIAGISNKQGNVLGMMPHPERASEEILGNSDGRALFQSIAQHIEGA
ncbi:phosphoribosylformylglycinamidine synthase subunit PurQ [Candidatus Magnetominusculus xianensis]|uniref:Phosphoribosylformylglycinamidine synthase subunit PurQ n=1 Tax=Candidatus Magnetominusculus xianensis TaxID=1748249 RepID=A0ABR5SGI1_9BACT|nr:phosphoribosylformylglycinamidine synthase subunit PurQ [Candidatus Magnetominusculus xianensis]KWT89822.1 phosphoribosylformylglycinamidine synthase 1 [Candidatus Magnetominusculus xianensis]MBF0404609.1 phosphoribosylformylglycinamidine synthase subunit PurQ [Nitrospirota bacterium]